MLKTSIICILFFGLSDAYGQKITNGTLTSSYMHTSGGSANLSSSTAEGAPVSELRIGSYRLSQGFFQYELKKTTHILDRDRRTYLTVFPNPFDEEIQIDLMNTGYGNIEFQVYNSLGQIVYMNTIHRPAGSDKIIPLRLRDVSAGSYTLSIRFLDDADSAPFVVNLRKQ